MFFEDVVWGYLEESRNYKETIDDNLKDTTEI